MVMASSGCCAPSGISPPMHVQMSPESMAAHRWINSAQDPSSCLKGDKYRDITYNNLMRLYKIKALITKLISETERQQPPYMCSGESLSYSATVGYSHPNFPSYSMHINPAPESSK